jgi:hypothetical protein
LSALPIVAVEAQRQTPVTRRQFRMLAHLPLSAPFAMLELDLSSMLSADTLGTIRFWFIF